LAISNDRSEDRWMSSMRSRITVSAIASSSGAAEQAVGLLQLLTEDRPRREDDPQPPVSLERAQVPAESRCVAHELLGRDLEEDDYSGLVELARASADELDAQGRLAGPDGALEQDDVLSRDPTGQNAIEAVDPGLYKVTFDHLALLSLAASSRPRRRGGAATGYLVTATMLRRTGL